MEENSIKFERIIDRFDKYMIVKKLNDNKVTCDLGISIGTIGKSRKIGRDLSSKVVELILNFYTDINRVWLLTGEGEMLNRIFFVDNSQRDGNIKIIGENNKHIYAGNNRNTGAINIKEEHKDEAYKAIIAEKEKIINNLQEQLRAKDEQLQSKDKIINSLIAKIK